MSKDCKNGSSRLNKLPALSRRKKRILKNALLGVVLAVAVLYIAGAANQIFLHFTSRLLYREDYSLLPSIKFALEHPKSLYYATGALVLFLLYIYDRKRHALIYHDPRGFDYYSGGTYGTSGWLSDREIGRVFIRAETAERAENVILGTYKDDVICLPSENKNQHIAVFGAPGTGKSYCFARPYIYEKVKQGHSIIVTDPKGELYGDTARMLEESGYTIKVFNLNAFDHSDSWNMLDEITGKNADLRAATLVDIIMQNTSVGEHGNQFFEDCLSNLLKAGCLYVATSDDYKGARTIGSAYELICKHSDAELDAIFSRLPTGDLALFPYAIYKQAGNLRSNIITNLGTRLQMLQNTAVCNITSTRDIDLTLPGKERCAYFVITSDQTTTFNFLASLFFSFLFLDLVTYADAQPARKLDVPVDFLLDEFPNILSIPGFTAKLATIRSRAMSCALIFQNLAQMENRYPHKLWEDLLGNCGTHICLGVTDQNTAQYISKRTGEVTIVVHTEKSDQRAGLFGVSAGGGSSQGAGKRTLLTMDEVLRMDPNKVLIIPQNEKVILLDKFPCTAHPLNPPESYHVSHASHIPVWQKAMLNTTENLRALGVDNILRAPSPDDADAYPDPDAAQAVPREKEDEDIPAPCSEDVTSYNDLLTGLRPARTERAPKRTTAKEILTKMNGPRR